jgi:hypothetical protein
VVRGAAWVHGILGAVHGFRGWCTDVTWVQEGTVHGLHELAGVANRKRFLRALTTTF